MKLAIFLLSALAVVLMVECSHTFLGTNVDRPLLYHQEVKHGAYAFRKRVEYFKYSLPNVPSQAGRYIQGIMAFDYKHSKSPVNVTEGGIGSNSVKLRMKSDRGESIHYDIYIYA